jgi:hypothetical protein
MTYIIIYAIFACTANDPCTLVPSLGSYSGMSACIAKLNAMKVGNNVVEGNRLIEPDSRPSLAYECDQIQVNQ